MVRSLMTEVWTGFGGSISGLLVESSFAVMDTCTAEQDLVEFGEDVVGGVVEHGSRWMSEKMCLSS